MSREPDELEYLSPGFDAATLTVPRLRNILLAQGVNYPSSSKKPQLVQLFNDHVAPKAKKILSARSRTKRSTRGIVDVPSSQASTVNDDDDEETEEEQAAPSHPTNRTRSSRRTTRAPEEDSDATLLAPTQANSRRTASKHARTSDAEPEERPTQRRPKSSKTPVVKSGEGEAEPWRRRQDVDSPFTSDNPFQSGSSPPAEHMERRRKSSLGPAKEKRKSTSRRKTEGPKLQQQDDDIKPPSRATFEMPLARVRRKKAAEREELSDDHVPAGEEFTPEETMDLVRARAKSGELNVVPPRRRVKQRSSTSVAKIAPLSILLAMLGGFAFVWRQEKLEVGYCGIGSQPTTELGGVEIPEWAKALQPQCEPCPPHAYCLRNLEARCESDFILKPHPLSLGRLVPLPPTCEPDSDKAQRIVTVADRAVEELRERNAKFECHEPLPGNYGKSPASPAISEDQLKESMSTQRRKKMSQEDFEELWKGAIGEILQRDEIVSDIDGESGRRTLRSTSLARQSFACALRQSIRDTLVRYLWPVIALILLSSSVAYTRYSITYNRTTEEMAKKLASFALDRLHTQAALHAADPGAYPEGFISMGHLRDDVLRDEFSASRRTKLWEKVQGKVEGNLNVRPMVREGRHGDVSRVWEWIGAVSAIDDVTGRSGSSSRRQSSRYSFGPVGGSSPMSELSTIPPPVKREESGEMVERRKWEESRPIY